MAFGTLAFDTLSVSGVITGTAKSVDADYLATGSAKAFHGFGDQASGALNGNSKTLNISSYEDTGTGRSRLNMTNAMSVALGYMVVGSTQTYTYGVFAVTASQYEVGAVNSGGSYADGTTHAVVMGDLA
tara:strand:- start:308 stop:694 length:387 start_codon:yes stop_codon:yes gene_type:complete